MRDATGRLHKKVQDKTKRNKITAIWDEMNPGRNEGGKESLMSFIDCRGIGGATGKEKKRTKKGKQGN